ncbi:MAG: COX15/CtaA family protein [Rhizobiales bacterium]|nr:COX15/CtaA family protein [Hyphomicrobiales bacterium]MBI3673090.1 COX15/CtaA family protein [Hyphomicrobiales bacterium]
MVPYLAAMEVPTPRQSAAEPHVRLWLYAMAFLVFAMVIVGGATRLTESGLSITEWQPLLGVIPPLTEAQWMELFDKYKLIPQARIVNPDMTLAGFKFIFWWEWSHRFLGRFIGVAYAVPLVWFVVTAAVRRSMWSKLFILLALGVLQGLLGWIMVKSGLQDRVSVSQYLLAAHLSAATFLFGAILWVVMGLNGDRRRLSQSADRSALTIAVLVFLQIAAGAFVAGLDAGMGYNTWPLMDGAIVPTGLFAMEPWWRNFFENALTVQFDHRMIAYVIAVLVAGFAVLARTPAALLLLGAVLVQIALGIATLLWQVPLVLALFHQGGALIVFAAALWNLHILLRRSPGPDRR